MSFSSARTSLKSQSSMVRGFFNLFYIALKNLSSLFFFNYLITPTGDKRQFSQNDIHTQSREKFVRINEIITYRKTLGSFTKFSLLILYANVYKMQRPVWRICWWILGLEGVDMVPVQDKYQAFVHYAFAFPLKCSTLMLHFSH